MITNKGAKRKVYGSWGEFFPDVLFVLRNNIQLLRVYTGGLPPALRERLMVAAATVYGCRFCSWFYTREALRVGVDKEELARFVGGVMEGCPEDYSIAVLYAQHWAESNAHPDLEAFHRLEETYGREKAALVNVGSAQFGWSSSRKTYGVPFSIASPLANGETKNVRSNIWIS